LVRPTPAPAPGLVIHYDYLWRRQHAEGIENAAYPRPCVVVIAVQSRVRDALRVLVAPITHSAPRPGQSVIALPPRVKQSLGLDSERSWIVVDEANEFDWPGYDVRPDRSGRTVYGFLPPKLYEQVRLAMLDRLAGGGLDRTAR
jgi:hypothetical protein